MIRVLYRHRSGTLISDLTIAQVPGAIKDSQARVWIDLIAPTPEEQQLVLVQMFRFHPLAVEDAVNEVHLPKVDDYGGYLYLVFHTLRLGDERMDIHTHEIDTFVGPNYLITLHDSPSTTIEKMWNETYHRERGLARGVAILLYEILDRQLDSFIPLLDQFEERVEEMGDLIFLHKSDNESGLLNEILTAKTSALRVRRILLPQREMLKHLSHDDLSTIPVDARIYYQDLYDHIQRLADLAESMRDLANSTMTTHLTLSSNRLNEVMKVLTIISTIFMPLSFIAGIYGMNFVHMPELYQPWGYPLIWLMFIMIPAGMLYFFRRRGWI
jgi:magnesium transporter